MALDLVLLGEKLQGFRLQFDLSLEEVSTSTGIPIHDLRSYEGGAKQPSGDQILVIADYYKCDYNYFVSNDRSDPYYHESILFRKHGDQLTKEDKWALHEFLFLCECEEYLMRLFEDIVVTDFVFHKQAKFFKAHGEKAAESLRKHMGYQANAIPLDVFRDFRGLGFHIFRRQISNSTISGLFINHPLAGKCIFINYCEDIYRQRFSCAHETAHAILDDDKEFVISFNWDRNNLSEIRANVFASHYLMPPEFLTQISKSERWTNDFTLDWANKLMVNPQPLAIALRNQNLIDSEQYNIISNLQIPIRRKADPEIPNDLSPKSKVRKTELLKRGLSKYYVDLCFRAYEEDHITQGRLTEMLLTDDTEIHEIANLYGRKLVYGN